MTQAQYAGVRADPTQFVVLPLHWIVRKTGEAGDYAEKLDPRSR
jgi:hypothetical protein